MPAAQAELSVDGAVRHVQDRCFGAPRAGSPAQVGPAQVGIEIEWIVHQLGDGRVRVPLADLKRAVANAGPLPANGKITYEPGGQLELSSLPAAGPSAACRKTAVDLAVLEPGLRACGIGLTAVGLDPLRRPERFVTHPRYEAMEAYFDEFGRAGRTMMCSTAAMQVNVDFGPDQAATWQLAHDLGATLAAAFANSPLQGGAPSGWRSTRLANWWAIDPSRTRAVGGPAADPADPALTFAAYVLDARVMLIRQAAGGPGVSPDEHSCWEPVLAPLTFGQWIVDGHCGAWPTLDDLDYHLTTLFPPIRPRGFLELRMIDTLPDPWWRVPVAVAATLLGDDPAVTGAAARAVAPVAGWWRHAARHATSDPRLQRAADTCFAITLDALTGGPDADLVPVVAAYRDRYVSRGRCPADDRLGAWSIRPAARAEVAPTGWRPN